MFRHKGKTRTFKHNLALASLLSFVAGLVNVVGFLSVQRLTTNVTGHFAMFVDEFYKQDYWQAIHYFLYTLFFLMGAFFSSFSIEMVRKIHDKYIFRFPIIVESLLLFTVAVVGSQWIPTAPYLIAYILLFAMGLQNALVTTISNAVVRTTHLTGLFTDLGIELSQLFFYKQTTERAKLTKSIKLRFTIITCFFLGGFVGGIGYTYMNFYVLVGAAIILMIGLVYDQVKVKIKRQLRYKY